MPTPSGSRPVAGAPAVASGRRPTLVGRNLSLTPVRRMGSSPATGTCRPGAMGYAGVSVAP